MYSRGIREAALSMVAHDQSINAVSGLLGVSRSAVRDWLDNGVEPLNASSCPLYDLGLLHRGVYAALFGFYLGDGCVSTYRAKHVLRIACDLSYPGIIEDVSECIRGVHPTGNLFHVSAAGCVHIQSNWKHWPCLFPQHGPGKKHERTLTLESWQQQIVDEDPAAFLRGLFHSDGCRITNWTTKGGKRYEYGRWMFTNHSTDIMRWCQEALDLIGVAWTMPRWNCLSVATRAGVACLDEKIGPKT